MAALVEGEDFNYAPRYESFYRESMLLQGASMKHTPQFEEYFGGLPYDIHDPAGHDNNLFRASPGQLLHRFLVLHDRLLDFILRKIQG